MAARPGKPVAIGTRLFTCVSAPPCEVRRDAGSDAVVGNKRRVLPAADAGHQAGDFRREFCELLRMYARRMGEGGSSTALSSMRRYIASDQLQAKRVSACLVTKP